jgi:predicted small secreted protein
MSRPRPTARGARSPIWSILLLSATLSTACAPPRGAAADVAREGEALPTAPPRFEDLPASSRYDGPPAGIDLDSHPRARTFRTALRAGVAGGPNFAGSLTVIAWGCGTMCQQAMVVDAATGRVLVELEAPLGWAFRPDSDLLIENSPGRVAESPCPACTTRYMVWEGGELIAVPGESFPPADMDPHARGLVIRTRAGERRALASAEGASREDWARLRLRIRDGSIQVEDEAVGVDLRRIHRFAASADRMDAWIVERFFVPEGGDWLAVDRASGEIAVLDAEPAIDPSGRWLATASLDLVAGHAPNRIRIQRTTDRTAVPAWTVEPREWGARAPRWIDSTTLELDRTVVRWSTHGEFVSPMRVRWSGSAWEAEPDPRHAGDVLRAFFDALAAGRYPEASRHYGGDYEVLRGWNPDAAPDDLPALWELACRHNGLQGLPEVEILELVWESTDHVVATVRFGTFEGETFVLGPCCGATAAEMPPRSEFRYRLRLDDGRRLVEDLPVYVP